MFCIEAGGMGKLLFVENFGVQLLQKEWQYSYMALWESLVRKLPML
jgi:hypothetical protein